MTAEIDVRKQRIQGAYARYEKDIFNSDLSERCKASLFNVVVVANGLFGCQVWSVTQSHVDDLEATYSRLLRKMLKKTKIEMSRGELLRYAELRNLNILPIEWRMTKLQLRYVGHEVRVAPDNVSKSPHNMLFRGHSGGGPRLAGGMEQSYPATIRRGLDACGLSGNSNQWVTIAKDRIRWKKYLEDEAKTTFMEKWYRREAVKKQQRSRSEDNREIRERAHMERLTEDLGDDREESEEITDTGRVDMGAESEENSDGESEGEDMERGLGDPCRRRVIMCEQVPPGVGVGDEEQSVEIIRLNAIASEAFVELFNYQDASVQNGVHGEESNITVRNVIVEAEDRQLIHRESFGDKRKRERKESQKQKRRERI